MKNRIFRSHNRRLTMGGFLAACMALVGATSVYPQQPQSAPGPNVSGDPLAEIRELRQRLDKCEAELQQAGVATPVPDAALPAAGDAVPARPRQYGPAPAGPVLTGPAPAAVNPGAPESVRAAMESAATITKPTVKVDGKVFLDGFGFSQNAANASANHGVGVASDYTGFREMRLQAGGDVFENMDYTLEYDLAGNLGVNNAENQNGVATALQQTAFKNVYSTLKNLPVVGNLRIGFFKEPLGMDQLTGDEYTMFMERALGNDVFAPSRRIGLMLFDYLDDQKLSSYYLGTFREGSAETQVVERSSVGDWSAIGRLAWLPYYDLPSEGRYLFHLGMASQYTGTNTNGASDVQFTGRPESRPTQNFIGTPLIAADDFYRYGAEALFINGPFSVQSEYTGVTVDRTAGGAVQFDSFYVEASYFLTGENRGYDLERKTPGIIKPFEPFFSTRFSDGGPCFGKGAWELAARYSFIDLRDKNVQGGRLDDFTLGLNWYPNSYSRLMINYIHSELDRSATQPTAGTANFGSFADEFGVRWQFVF